VDSPYKTPWRLQDVIAAIQVMGSSAWVTKRIREWEESLGTPRSADTWEEVLRDHPEFFYVRVSPWISGAYVKFDPLIAKLKVADTPLSRYLKEQFSPPTRELLNRHDLTTAVSEDLKTLVHRELNSIIRRREFSREEALKDCGLPPELEARLHKLQLLPVDARMIRNRLVLEAEYPEEIDKEDFEARAALTWRSAYDKNYNADQARELTAAEMKMESFEVRDRLSRRPLDSEQIRSLVTTALEMHSRVLAGERGLLDLQAEVRANKQQGLAEAAQQLQVVQGLINEMRSQREEAREVKQASRWWIPLAIAVLSFVGVIVGAILGAALKTK